MKKTAIIIGLAFLVTFTHCAEDAWVMNDNTCTGNTNCKSMNVTTNSNYTCCPYEYEIDGTKKTRCIGILKDKDVIEAFKQAREEAEDGENDYKFKGVDCDSQIAKITFGVIMILAFFF